MAELREDIIAWLNELPYGTLVGIHDGGLALQASTSDADMYFEIGGMPEDEPDEDDGAGEGER